MQGTVLTAIGMRAAEQAAIASGIPEYDLMERAGAAAADIIWRAGERRDALVLCGPGNNGGDGFVIARLLRARGVPVRVAALGESRTSSSLRARAAWAGPVESLDALKPAAQLVDALFGTGLTHGLDDRISAQLGRLVGVASHSYAVDLPSGVETDGGALLSPVPRFGMCIALGALKPAHLLYPAAGRIGRLICADIGIAATSSVCRLAPPLIQSPAPEAHKYSRGLVAVVGGAMVGASLLASHAAARSGAGMVLRIAADTYIGGPEAILTKSAMTAAEVGLALQDKRLAAVLVGPGLGRNDEARERLNIVAKCGYPLVLDADALNMFAGPGVNDMPAQAILTPHEAEFRRLFGNLPGSKVDRALEAAHRSRCFVVYKGADTVIAAPDGRAAVATRGSSWLSTAGTGDVLAGLVAGRLAVTQDGFRAACEAVWLHGEAARRAGVAFIADDLIERLPDAIASRL